MFRILSRLIGVALFLGIVLMVIVIIQTEPTRYVFKDAEWNTIETAGKITASSARTEIVGRLEGPKDLDYFSITVTKPQEIVLRLQTDAADRDFNPELIVFGRGLPVPKAIDIPIGNQNGAIVSRVPADKRMTSFAIQAMTSYTDGPVIRTTLPAAGTYAVVVRSPEGVSGRYVLTNGTVPDRSFDGWRSSITGSIRVMLRVY